MMADSVEWLAGIMEGEACFTMARRGGRIQIATRLVMIDEDIIRRAQAVIGRGRVWLRPARLPNRQDTWNWDTYGYQAMAVALRLYPYLGTRRRRRISEILRAWTNQPPLRNNYQREKTHCKYGHPFDKTNTYVRREKDGIRRQCRACKLAESRRRRQRERK